LPAGEDVGVLLPEPNIHVLHAGLTTLAEDEIVGRTDVTDQVTVVVDNRLHGSACGGSGEGTGLDGLVANQGLRIRLRTELEDVAASADLAVHKVGSLAAVGYVTSVTVDSWAVRVAVAGNGG